MIPKYHPPSYDSEFRSTRYSNNYVNIPPKDKLTQMTHNIFACFNVVTFFKNMNTQAQLTTTYMF